MPYKDCLNRWENENDCPCQEYNCERHGICCECVKYHIKTKSLPACLKNKK